MQRNRTWVPGRAHGRNPVDCSLFVLARRLWIRKRLRARTSEPMRGCAASSATGSTVRTARRRTAGAAAGVQATLVGLAEMECLLDRAEQLLARRVSTRDRAQHHQGRAQGRRRRARLRAGPVGMQLATQQNSATAGWEQLHAWSAHARCSTSTWTHSMRRSNDGTIRTCAEAVGGGARGSGAWWRPLRTRPAASACARLCRPYRSAEVSDLILIKQRSDVYKAVSGGDRGHFRALHVAD